MRSTETVMVLSILLLTTLPMSKRCPATGTAPAAASVVCASVDITVSPGAARRIYGVDATPTYRARCAGKRSFTHLGKHRLYARNVLAHLRKLIRFRRLTRGTGHAQIE